LQSDASNCGGLLLNAKQLQKGLKQGMKPQLVSALSVTHKACHLSRRERLRVVKAKEQFLRHDFVMPPPFTQRRLIVLTSSKIQ